MGHHTHHAWVSASPVGRMLFPPSFFSPFLPFSFSVKPFFYNILKMFRFEIIV
jgi:hypothetical protein